MTVDYPGGPNVITRVLVRGKQEVRITDGKMEAEVRKTERLEDGAKELTQAPLGAGRSKRKDSPLELPEAGNPWRASRTARW